MANAVASSSRPHKEKRDKKDKKERKEKKDKKDRSSKHSSKSSSRTAIDGPFEHRVQRMRLSVPPKFSADWLVGVREVLNGMLMQYVPQMGGVLLAHWEHEFVDDTVRIINECPFGVCEVQFHSVVWAPKVGQVLYGTHSLSSPSHLSLLFAKTFNVSIPLQHIPLNKYEFEHTDDVADEDDDDLLSDDEVDNDLLTPPSVHEVGRWKEQDSGKVLGATERVRFTVIGLQVTHQMLSLTGSLLDDPSNPPPAPTAEVRPRSPSPDLLDLPERPAKVARVASTPAKAAATPSKKAAIPAAPATPAIDESKMTARELKQYRKEQARAKRDARKERKAGEDDEDEAELPAGTKRKADEDEGGERKKKRTD